MDIPRDNLKENLNNRENQKGHARCDLLNNLTR